MTSAQGAALQDPVYLLGRSRRKSPTEMAELWELEGPSFYGLAHPRSAALDSPTWSTPPWQSSESETSISDTTLNPSEVASESMTDGPGPITRGPLAYNVCLPYELDLACFQQATPEEATLKKSLHLWATSTRRIWKPFW